MTGSRSWETLGHKNDDSPRNLRYLTFPESFYWLIAKAQTQDPIRSLEKLETRFFPQAILANQRHGKRANGYFGVRNQDIKTAGFGRSDDFNSISTNREPAPGSKTYE